MKKILLVLLAIARCAAAQTITINQNFASDPATQGWQIYGDTNLFQWDSTNKDLAVTWDSSQSNSYYFHPIGTFLTSGDDFSLSFDLYLNDATILNNTFELAAGLLRFVDATNAGFLRGTGYNTTNLVEFDYFMDPVYGNSPSVTEYDTNGAFADVYDFVPMTTNTTYHVAFSNIAGSSLVSASITVSNDLYTAFPYTYTLTGFSDYRVDTIAIMNYSDEGAYGNASILAHGTIANLQFTATPRPVANIKCSMVGGAWQAQFTSRTNWNYTLQRSTDLKTWTPATVLTKGTDQTLLLQDLNPPATQAFYRVQAQQ